MNNSNSTKANSSSDLRARFAELRNRTSTSSLNKGLIEAEEQDNSLTAQFNLNESDIYRILLDTSLDKTEMFERINEMLVIDFEDKESERHPSNEKFGQRTGEVRSIIKKIVADYNEHNRECMRLSRDNPLSELKKSLQEVMDNYRDVVKGRGELKSKVDNVESLISELGGEKELVQAIVEAIDKQKEAGKLAEQLEGRNETVDGINREIRKLEIRKERLEKNVAEHEGKWFVFGEAKRQFRSDKEELANVTDSLTVKQEELARERTVLEEAADTYRSFVNDGRYSVHEKVLSILDIGDEGFKEKIHELAKATLDYVDNTEATLTGIHDQLEIIRKRTGETLDVNANIGDKVEVLRKALESATRKNTSSLKAFKDAHSKTGEPVVEGLEELNELGAREIKKIEQAAHSYVADLDNVLITSTTLTDQLQNLHVSLLNLKDIVEQGLTRAETQQIIAVTIATQSGQNMLDGAQALAALVQALINEGQFQNDAVEAYEDGLKMMERSLLSRQSRVSSIDRMANLTRQMSEALDASNDATLDISLEEKEQLERLSDAMEDLKEKAERKVGLHTEVIDAYAKRISPDTPEPGMS